LSTNSTLRATLAEEIPLQIVGVPSAYIAKLAELAGFKALYLSGAAIANNSFGLPDLGLTTFPEVAEEVRRIKGASSLPLLVDMDTGWGGSLTIARAIRTLEQAGASAVHIEDQDLFKRCGHRAGKAVVSIDKMASRIKACVDSRANSSFLIMARSDAIAEEGIEKTIERAFAYQEAGADLFFPEAVDSLEGYQQFRKALKIPILANLTEFGKTPLFSLEELRSVGVDIALYPLSAFRTMAKAALSLFHTLRTEGTQKSCVEAMQTRAELYKILDYERQETIIDNERESN
jgi:methylisocitrate lyase